ncbi:DUF397 domain-containing protein [Allostreptomyces psammosilenae]|uniref:DUF397 domain-containing protein n=1 Tax=Allostreptomyces psammosilenae TaxID=1892865 RepID=UPI0015C99C71|nr:DUF397 domain-containing protein [Allostreptomyces psammosilenae]
MPRNEWLKSSYSADTAQCIEWAPGTPSVIPVRDSKDPSGPALLFEPVEWAAFISALKAGRL